MMHRYALLFSLFASAILGSSLFAEDQVADPPPALKTFHGRTIAQTMHYLGAEWLTRDSREKEERSSLLMKNLGLKPGMTACDLGCGNGYYTLKMAEVVGKEGKVLAVDIQPKMLQFLRARADEAEVKNIELILGELHDPKLPAGKVDLILLVDVYHEFSHPKHLLKAMRDSLSKDGVCVLVEYREEDPKVPIKPLHKMSKKQILKEWLPAGFKVVRQYDGMPWQHVMVFGRDETPSKDEPKP
ncbi:MAG: methyltransferase domain-containing protein [bacterium]|nr:methyltransferase domain-containing protein [bacterium]